MAAVMALAVAGAMLSGSGFAAAWGAEPPSTTDAQSRLENTSSDIAPSNEPVEGPITNNDGSIIGLLSSGLGALTSAAGLVGGLDTMLVGIGFPAWFAYNLAPLAVLFAGIGIIQFGVNRRWR
jgi:hypothetical protein